MKMNIEIPMDCDRINLYIKGHKSRYFAGSFKRTNYCDFVKVNRHSKRCAFCGKFISVGNCCDDANCIPF